MPTVVIKPGATVFITGVNGLIGSYVAEQLLVRGYNVRGAVRSIEKTKWLREYFDGKGFDSKLELVEVPDMTIEGCYDDLLEGIEGFVHLAAPLGGILDLEFALNMGKGAGINALKACAKNPSVKRFVNTSSSTAASLSKPDIGHEIFMDTNTYNDEAYEQAKAEQGRAKGFLIYAAMKTETERAMWQWVKENNPDFVMNTILPNVNFGAVLVPEHQGYPSTIDWAHGAWTGENLEVYAKMVDPQWFVSILDSALLHIAALIYSEVNSERLFGYTERWNFNDLLAIYRKHYPERKFAQDFDGLGRDWVIPPTDRAEEVLKWVKGSGWDGLEESVVAMSKNCLHGPAMQITVIASDLAERTWRIPKSLLAHHAGYFRRTDRFKEGEQNKVTFESFEPEIFELFVEFMYFGRYSYCDDLQDATRIRDSAKAWVMGDYLDAVGFKNFALKNLHGIYFPPDNQAPRSTVGPELIDYCCAMSPVNSSLYNLISDVLIVFWDDCNVVIYNDTNNKQWDEIWDEHRKFRNSILYYTNQTKSGRAMRRLPVKDYL